MAMVDVAVAGAAAEGAFVATDAGLALTAGAGFTLDAGLLAAPEILDASLMAGAAETYAGAAMPGVVSSAAPEIAAETVSGAAPAVAATPEAVAGPSAELTGGPQVGINQVANAPGVVSDVGVNPDYTAWQNALNSGQTIPNNPLPGEFNPSATPTPTANQVLNAPAYSSTPTGASYSGQGLNPGAANTGPLNAFAPQSPSGIDSLGSGFNSALNWMGDHPIVTGLGMYFGAKQLGLGRPTTYSTPGASNTMNTGHYNLNPSTFQPGRMPVTQNPVQPTYPNYAVNPYPGPGMASGGIASFRSGGNSGYQNYKDTMGQYELMNQYENMMTGSNAPSQQTPAWVSDQGIVKDTDPTTSKMAAMDAANYNQAKTMAGAGMPTSAGIGMVKPSMNYGSINTDPAMVRAAMAQQQQQIQGAAQGGIMGYSLGGYASGGNPRLLKGPGDGMSDNIPATIGDRQPARLADGEFVVPADVVSHLGNGSTDAGAQKLHTMMDKVRMDRTGKKKQAPAVKADKYIPK